MKRMLGAHRAANRPAPHCGHRDDLIEAAALGLLEPAQRSALAERLATCADCRARFADASLLTGTLRQLIPAEAASAPYVPEENVVVADFRMRRLTDERRHGVEAAGAPTGAPTGARPTGRSSRRRAPVQAMRTTRLANVVNGLAAALLLLVLVGGFWFLGPGRGHGGLVGGTRPRPTSTATPAFPSLPYLPGGIPTACVNVAATSAVGPLNGAVGAAPFWVGGFQRPQATILLGDARVQHVPYGWHGNLTWGAKSGFSSPITVTGANIRGGEPLWFKATGAPGLSAVLDPLAAAPRSAGGETWATGEFTVYVPRAGCYALQATWSGGSWRVTFAAGNPDEPAATATTQPTP